MVTFGRVLLWTVVLVAPGGFLLVPVLAAAELGQRGSARPPVSRGAAAIAAAWREQLGEGFANLQRAVAKLQRYWTKS